LFISPFQKFLFAANFLIFLGNSTCILHRLHDNWTPLYIAHVTVMPNKGT
jgi:hypothetical protein